jgi:hypothetical protein
MKTLILQSYRPQNAPRWIGTVAPGVTLTRRLSITLLPEDPADSG